MELIIVILFSISTILFLLSFFKKDRVKYIQEEVEQLSLSYMQDIYQLKKKISILEEELLIQENPSLSKDIYKQVSIKRSNKPFINEIIKNQVISLYHQGLSLEQISKQSTIHVDDIVEIIEEQQERGNWS